MGWASINENLKRKVAEGDNTHRQMAGQLVLKSFSPSCFGVLSFEDGWAVAADSPGVGVAGKMKGGGHTPPSLSCLFPYDLLSWLSRDLLVATNSGWPLLQNFREIYSESWSERRNFSSGLGMTAGRSWSCSESISQKTRERQNFEKHATYLAGIRAISKPGKRRHLHGRDLCFLLLFSQILPESNRVHCLQMFLQFQRFFFIQSPQFVYIFQKSTAFFYCEQSFKPFHFNMQFVGLINIVNHFQNTRLIKAECLD